jgi:hypothetical protein
VDTGRGRREPFFSKVENFFFRIYGPAQLGGDGSQPEKPRSRTAGISGDWEMREDSTGRPYLVRRSGE